MTASLDTQDLEGKNGGMIGSQQIHILQENQISKAPISVHWGQQVGYPG